MGTPNLSGTYTGTGSILIRASSPPNLFGHTLAASDCCLDWEWNFDGCDGTLTAPNPGFLAGNLYPSADAPSLITTCIPYAITGPGGSGPIRVIDNCDGTYTVCYNWSITGPFGTRARDTNIRLEITELRDCNGNFTKLAIATWPQGYSSIPGTPLPSPYDTSTPPPAGQFFNHATPDWRGCAES